MRTATGNRAGDLQEKADRGVTLLIVATIIGLMLAFGLGPDFLMT